MYSSSVFTAGRPLCTQILRGQRVPINHFCHQKTRDIGLPDGKYRIPLRSLVLMQYWSVTDGRTYSRMEGQADGYAVAYTTLAKLALRRAVKSDTAIYEYTSDINPLILKTRAVELTR